MDIWTGSGTWDGWRLTTDHAASSYGQPVLVDPDGQAYGPGDIRKRIYQADYARELGVSTAAIRSRIRSGTLPEYDGTDEHGRGYWYAATLQSGRGSGDLAYRVVCSNGWSDTIHAKNDVAAKKAASRVLKRGCGHMSLFRADGSHVGTREFWQDYTRFGWRPWRK